LIGTQNESLWRILYKTTLLVKTQPVKVVRSIQGFILNVATIKLTLAIRRRIYYL